MTKPGMPPDYLPNSFALDADAVVEILRTDIGRGLDAAEAEERLARHGPNALVQEQAVPAWKRFVAQFSSALVLLLLAASAVSVGLWLYQGDTSLPYEAMAIVAVVLLNAVMGYVQESRARQAVEALRKMTALKATVIRDGERHDIPASELVVGDVLVVDEGDTVAADARVVSSASLQTSESALTGESLPVVKNTPAFADDAALPLADRANMIFSGTSVVYGHGLAVVTAIGMASEVGRVAGLLSSAEDQQTPLQRELDRTGRVLGAVVMVIAVIMIVTIVIVEDVHGLENLTAVLILGVALAVAAVPEGLPAVVTAVLSLGVQRMAGRNAIVRDLAAVETLGSASVVASDKTGTLTTNEMTVRLLATASGNVELTGAGYSPEGDVRSEDGGEVDGSLRSEMETALIACHLANNAEVRERDGDWMVDGDPTEGALMVAFLKAGLDEETIERRLPRIGEIPFSSERKLMSTLNGDDEREGVSILFTKGAPDVLLERCTKELVGESSAPLTPGRRELIGTTAEEMANRALRTIGVALREIPGKGKGKGLSDGAGVLDEAVEHELVFVALVGMMDPPRPEAAEAVRKALGAGIRPLMITGDHPRTALAVARELAITDQELVVTGRELAAMSDEELQAVVASTSVYARVDPEHKLRIVRALQARGEVVAMTGDGVNDAPALKMADIGVAMGITGTDVSKQAADIVLADDDFATIVIAVEEGRAIFANIRKFLRFLLSSNIGEVLTMFFGVLFADLIGLPAAAGGVVLPLTAAQILWINLVTDGPPALALGMDTPQDGLMHRPPRPREERVITPRMWRDVFLVGLVMAVSVLLVIDHVLPGGMMAGTGTLPHAQTMAFNTLVLSQLFNLFNSRSDSESAFVRPFSNRWLWGAVVLSLFLQLLVNYVQPLQRAFGTTPLDAFDWLVCLAAASMVLWFREGLKLVERGME